MTEVEPNDVLKIIIEVAKSIKYNGYMLNERYLHHFFFAYVTKEI